MMAKGKSDDGLVPVVYIGKKPRATDNVARSGKAWNGHGDVQRVTVMQATILTKFPDQWQVADGRPLPGALEIEERLAQIQVPPRGAIGSSGKRLDDMDEAELVIHAMHYYELELDPKLPREDMLDKIDEAVKRAGQDAEFARNQEITGGSGAFGPDLTEAPPE